MKLERHNTELMNECMYNVQSRIPGRLIKQYSLKVKEQTKNSLVLRPLWGGGGGPEPKNTFMF